MFLSWLVLGARPARAARAAMYADEFSAFKALSQAGVWRRLREAAFAHPSAIEMELRDQIRTAARDARQAWSRVCVEPPSTSVFSKRAAAVRAFQTACSWVEVLNRQIERARARRTAFWETLSRGTHIGERSARRLKRQLEVAV